MIRVNDLDLASIVDGVPSANTDALLVIIEARSDYPISLRRLLTHHSRAHRLFGLVRLTNEFGGGAETALACVLADKLVKLFLRNRTSLGLGSEQYLQVLGALVSSFANSLYQEGRFQETVVLVESLPAVVPGIDTVDGYWNAVALSVRGLARRFDIIPARKLLEGIPSTFHDVEHYSLAQSAVEGIVQKRFDVPRRVSLLKQHASVWFDCFEEQMRTLEALRDNFAQVPFESERFEQVDIAIGEAIEELRHFSPRIDSYTDTYSLRTDMIGTFKRFNAIMRRVQNLPDISSDTVNVFHIDQIIEESQWHIELGTVTDEQYKQIDQCIAWCRQSEDIHGQLMLAWCAALMATESAQAKESRTRLIALVDMLTDLVQNSSNPDTRGGFANFFYDLPGKVFDRFSGEDVQEIVRATELRKNRALLSMSQHTSPSIDYKKPGLLGGRTHYFALSVLENTDRILTTLYCADGHLTSDEIELSIRQIRQSARQVAPHRWTQKPLFGPPGGDLPEKLRPLLHPLADALSNEHIKPGDHVCIAADDPICLLPIQYIRLLDGYCIEQLSLSRVTSFSEALSIVSKSPTRPKAGLFVTAPVDEKFQEQKVEAADRLWRKLNASLSPTNYHEAPIEHESFLESLCSGQLIHINAHGYFPPESQDAFRHAGLLLPTTTDQQLRSGASDRILSSSDILNANINLRDSHVTLNACVSGVGLPGYGGDILGLEFALRSKGAASVLATHWDVRWPLSTVFLERFYDKWLTSKLSRANAWRSVTCDLINDPPIDNVRLEEWCAFSLFGDWR